MLILLAVVLVPVALIARVPQALGIWQSHPERLFDQTPDPALGRSIMGELETAGLATEGMTVWVFRDPDSDSRVTYALLDPSDGYLFPTVFDGDPVLATIGQLGTASLATDGTISRVGINIQGPEGTSIVIVTASSEDAADYAAGSIDEQTFMERLDGWVDPTTLAITQLSGEEP